MRLKAGSGRRRSRRGRDVLLLSWRQNVTFKKADTTSTKCSIPSGMRIFDVRILAEAITKLNCSACNSHLALYESEYIHGWHTIFYIKCVSCHQLFSKFASRRPLKTDTTKDTFVNAKLRMNEVTMCSVLSIHCSGFSLLDLQEFVTIFEMPSHYPTRSRKSLSQQQKYPCKLQLMSSMKKLVIYL